MYYGEGSGGSKVAVLDPATGIEHVLLDGGLPASDVILVAAAQCRNAGTNQVWMATARLASAQALQHRCFSTGCNAGWSWR